LLTNDGHSRVHVNSKIDFLEERRLVRVVEADAVQAKDWRLKLRSFRKPERIKKIMLVVSKT
jgi:hypothetical protein